MYAVRSEHDDDIDEIMEEYGEEEGNLASVYTSHTPPIPDPTPSKKKSSKKKKGSDASRRNRRKDLFEEDGSEKIPSSNYNKDSVSPQYDNENLTDISQGKLYLSMYHDE